jgi:hypothetical protein
MSGITRFLRSLGLSAVCALPFAVVLGQGCTMGQEICDLQCDCTKCSDRAYDDCVDSYDRSVEVADAYDCRTEFDDLHECYVDNFDCDEKDNQIEGPDFDDCADEQKEYSECVADASDIIGGGSGPSQQNSTTGTSGACQNFIALCVSCGVGTQQECTDATVGADEQSCQAGYDQLVAAGC